MSSYVDWMQHEPGVGVTLPHLVFRWLIASRPGDLIAGRPVSSCIQPFSLPIQHLEVEMLRHSIESAEYASHEYPRLAADFAITMSMSKKADCWDNAAMESFFETLKVERICQVRYDTPARARLDIVDWIEGFYNRVRMHTAIGNLAPVKRECSLLAA